MIQLQVSVPSPVQAQLTQVVCKLLSVSTEAEIGALEGVLRDSLGSDHLEVVQRCCEIIIQICAQQEASRDMKFGALLEKAFGVWQTALSHLAAVDPSGELARLEVLSLLAECVTSLAACYVQSSDAAPIHSVFATMFKVKC